MASLSEMEMIFPLTLAFRGSVILLLITKNYRVSVGEHRLELLEGRFLFSLTIMSRTYGYLCTWPSFSNFFSPLIGVQFRLVKIAICICVFDQPSMRTSKPRWGARRRPLPRVGRSTERFFTHRISISRLLSVFTQQTGVLRGVLWMRSPRRMPH